MPPGGLIPLEWIRSIDDIFAIWPHGTDRLMEFLTYINPSHPTIKFEYEYSHKSVHFLDTRIHINESNLVESDLYIKPTDRTLLLHHDPFTLTPAKQVSYTVKHYDIDALLPTMTHYTNITSRQLAHY